MYYNQQWLAFKTTEWGLQLGPGNRLMLQGRMSTYNQSTELSAYAHSAMIPILELTRLLPHSQPSSLQDTLLASPQMYSLTITKLVVSLAHILYITCTWKKPTAVYMRVVSASAYCEQFVKVQTTDRSQIPCLITSLKVIST